MKLQTLYSSIHSHCRVVFPFTLYVPSSDKAVWLLKIWDKHLPKASYKVFLQDKDELFGSFQKNLLAEPHDGEVMHLLTDRCTKKTGHFLASWMRCSVMWLHSSSLEDYNSKEHTQPKWVCPMVVQETVLQSAFNQIHWIFQYYKQFITVIFPHRWLNSSVPLTHLTPPGNDWCQPSAFTVPNVISCGTQHEHSVIIFNLSSVCYHSA